MIGDLEDMSGERLDHDRGARKDEGARTAALLRRPVRPSIEEFADGGVPVWSSGCSAMASLPLASHASFLLWYAMDAKHRLTDRLQRDKSIIHRSSGDVL